MRLRDSRPRAALPMPPLAALRIEQGLPRPGRGTPTVENRASFYPSLTKLEGFAKLILVAVVSLLRQSHFYPEMTPAPL